MEYWPVTPYKWRQKCPRCRSGDVIAIENGQAKKKKGVILENYWLKSNPPDKRCLTCGWTWLEL